MSQTRQIKCILPRCQGHCRNLRECTHPEKAEIIRRELNLNKEAFCTFITTIADNLDAEFTEPYPYMTSTMLCQIVKQTMDYLMLSKPKLHFIQLCYGLNEEGNYSNKMTKYELLREYIVRSKLAQYTITAIHRNRRNRITHDDAVYLQTPFLMSTANILSVKSYFLQWLNRPYVLQKLRIPCCGQGPQEPLPLFAVNELNDFLFNHGLQWRACILQEINSLTPPRRQLVGVARRRIYADEDSDTIETSPILPKIGVVMFPTELEVAQKKECPVCYDEFVLGAQTQCGHSYCTPCMTKIVSVSKHDCPMCRTAITDVTLCVDLDNGGGVPVLDTAIFAI